ncbi:MAG: hypothetical protein JNK87_05690 [Bryobacterales bacterium]|nr:hypothetical protein [Bryobacterales bacterium]
MAHFFIDEGQTAQSMAPAAAISLSTGGTRRLGLWGARVGSELLVAESADDTIVYVARDPFGRSIPVYSVDMNGHLRGIPVIARHEGSAEIIARLGSNNSTWARIAVTVTGSASATGRLTVKLHDRRLSGLLPRSTATQRTVETSENISTTQTILNVAAAARELAREPSGMRMGLEVYCHGLEFSALHRPMNRDANWLERLYLRAFGEDGQGGAGLLLGADLVTNRNVMTVGFERWAGLFELITLYACGPAYIEPGVRGLGNPGDGWALCTAIARQTRTPIKASSATQVYSIDLTSGELNFGDWEGTVYTINP